MDAEQGFVQCHHCGISIPLDRDELVFSKKSLLSFCLIPYRKFPHDGLRLVPGFEAFAETSPQYWMHSVAYSVRDIRKVVHCLNRLVWVTRSGFYAVFFYGLTKLDPDDIAPFQDEFLEPVYDPCFDPSLFRPNRFDELIDLVRLAGTEKVVAKFTNTVLSKVDEDIVSLIVPVIDNDLYMAWRSGELVDYLRKYPKKVASAIKILDAIRAKMEHDDSCWHLLGRLKPCVR